MIAKFEKQHIINPKKMYQDEAHIYQMYVVGTPLGDGGKCVGAAQS